MIITNDILNDMLGLRNIFDDFFTAAPSRYADAGGYPALNLHETEDTIEVRALVPGVTADDITLELQDRDLVIAGERKKAPGRNAYIRRERDFGAFKRIVRLTVPVEPNRIDARLRDGVLHVTLTKSEAAKPKRIQIQ